MSIDHLTKWQDAHAAELWDHHHEDELISSAASARPRRQADTRGLVLARIAAATQDPSGPAGVVCYSTCYPQPPGMERGYLTVAGEWSFDPGDALWTGETHARELLGLLSHRHPFFHVPPGDSIPW